MTAAAETTADRVDKGAALLDDRMPGWHEQVDVELLALRHPRKCVFGQLFADRADGWRTGFDAGVDAILGAAAYDAAGRYGFNLGSAPETYDALTIEWKRVILTRRDAANAARGEG